MGKDKKNLIQVAKKLSDKNLVAGMDGNLSMRTSKGMVITASGVYKGQLSKKDLIEIDFQGNILQGSKKPSSEFRLHAMVYGERPDVKVVIHAHPPLITALSIMGFPLIPCLTAEAFLLLGLVPMVPYQAPGEQALAEACREYVHKTDQLIMSKHGAIVYGQDLWVILDKLEKMEMLAVKIFNLLQSNFPLENSVFTFKERQQLSEKKKIMGLQNLSCDCPEDTCHLISQWRKEYAEKA